jgi:hypothetical protein
MPLAILWARLADLYMSRMACIVQEGSFGSYAITELGINNSTTIFNMVFHVSLCMLSRVSGGASVHASCASHRPGTTTQVKFCLVLFVTLLCVGHVGISIDG